MRLGVLLWLGGIVSAMGKVNTQGNSRGSSSEYTRTSSSNIQVSAEKRLTRHMLARYHVLGQGGRPVLNASSPTIVHFGLGLIQMELDEREKVLVSSMWVKMRWHDVYLQWNPMEWDGVEKVRMDASQIWVPDVMLINTADPGNEKRNSLVLVYYNGNITWVPHQIFRSSCSIDVTAFPFDHQVCHMWFGSWTHTTREIDLALADEGLDVTTFQADFHESSEWEMVNHTSQIIQGDDPTDYSVLFFELHVKRKVVFSSYILTLPCVFLASLTLVVFCLPPERPDRTALSMSLFSSFLVLLLILVEAAPPTASSVPKLGLYYCFNMVIIMLSIFLSSLVVNVNRAAEGYTPLPRLVKLVLIEITGKLLFISDKCEQTPNPASNPGNKHEESHDFNDDQSHYSACEYSGIGPISSAIPEGQSLLECYLWKIESHMQEMKQCMKQILIRTEDHCSKTTSNKDVMNEWKLAAKVLDRLFFSVYLIGILISLATLFPKA